MIEYGDFRRFRTVISVQTLLNQSVKVPNCLGIKRKRQFDGRQWVDTFSHCRYPGKFGTLMAQFSLASANRIMAQDVAGAAMR
jgi:hypothetical protein